jgi:sulfate adenylyltransferase subunit 1
MPWYNKGTLLSILETIPVSNDYNLKDGRFPVQCIIRPEKTEFHDYRGYAGRVCGGVFRKGDKIRVLPSGLTSEIEAIDTMNGEIREAFPPMSVTLRLKDDLDISRGDLIVPEKMIPQSGQDIDLMICWMNQVPMNPNGKYLIRHMTREGRCMIKKINYILNINTLQEKEGEKEVKLNEIASITLRTTQPMYFDKYSINRFSGSLILIDESTFETVGAGMII